MRPEALVPNYLPLRASAAAHVEIGYVTGDYKPSMHLDVAPACGCREGQGAKKISEIRVRVGNVVNDIELVFASGETVALA